MSVKHGTEVTGTNFIACEWRGGGPATFTSVSPRDGEPVPASFHEATSEEITDGCMPAEEAADALR